MHEFDINMQSMFFQAFWYIICIFPMNRYFSMHFTSFKLLQQFFWKKKAAQDFLYTGPFDPQRLTGAPKATLAGHLGLVGWGVAQPDRLPGTPETGHGSGYGARRGAGKRAAGPGTHRGTAREVSLAGGWPETMNSAVEMVRSGEVIRRFGGDSGRFRSIPWAGRKRAALWTFSARRRGRGRHGTAALDGSHGGRAPLLAAFSRERERDRGGKRRAAREEIRRRRRRRRPGAAPRSLLGLGSVSMRWSASSKGKTRTCFTVLEVENNVIILQRTPWLFGEFSGSF
jgi:hypothetical protein